MDRLPFGFWPSPLRAAQAAAGRRSLSELRSDGSWLYWLESRPEQGGRVVLVRSDGDVVREISPDGVNIRSRVHEYGGGAWCPVPAHGPEAFAYVDLPDQRVRLMEEGSVAPRAVSRGAPAGVTWAHGGLSATSDGRWIMAVRQTHRPGSLRPQHCVVALGTGVDNVGESIVAEGHDFYGAPRVNDGGDRLAVLVWDHPDMSWDNSAIEVIPLRTLVDDTTTTATSETTARSTQMIPAGPAWVVAGGAAGGEESVGQPAWQGDGSLRFVSDRRGWWQPYRHPGEDATQRAESMTEEEAEFHGPDWVLGQTTMAELPDGSLVARRTSHGQDALVHLTAPQGRPAVVSQPCVAISALCRHGDGVAFIGAPADGPEDVWVLPAPGQAVRSLRPHRAMPLAPADVSVGEPFALTGRSGRAVYGVLYPPKLGDTEGPPGRLPPLVVSCHGGPTSSAGAGFDATVQYFTSRGLAVARVDYAGSTGYGRAYRCSLWGQWGVADSEDCVDAARYLAATGRVDGDRMATRGGSAGGLTALNALASGAGFTAAVAWYGVTDLVGLAASSHDFEASYTDRLIGPLPESLALYEARSPVQRAAHMGGAVLLLQGTEDPVVPPAQAERLRDALEAAGRRCTVHFFEGESHGFRRAETLVACLEEELDFYRNELRL